MAAWLIQMPLGSFALLAQPLSRAAQTSRQRRWRMVKYLKGDGAGRGQRPRQKPRAGFFSIQSGDDQNRVHFHRGSAGQGGNADGGASRGWLPEVTAHDLIDLGEVAEVGEENVQFDDVFEAATGRFGHRLEVLEHLYGLGFKAFDQLHGGGVEGDLPGHVDGVAGFDRLRVSADGGRGFVAADNGLVHGVLLNSRRGGWGVGWASAHHCTAAVLFWWAKARPTFLLCDLVAGGQPRTRVMRLTPLRARSFLITRSEER